MKKLKAKQIKRLRAEILYYQSWLPIINETFNVNISYKDIINSIEYNNFIFNKSIQYANEENYKLLNLAYKDYIDFNY